MPYAIVQVSGKQFKVAAGDTINVDRLDLEAGATTTLDQVVLFADGDTIKTGKSGAPFVAGASVAAEVVEEFKDKKGIAFKFKRRKGYHRTVGYRRRLTKLKINSVALA